MICVQGERRSGKTTTLLKLLEKKSVLAVSSSLAKKNIKEVIQGSEMYCDPAEIISHNEILLKLSGRNKNFSLYIDDANLIPNDKWKEISDRFADQIKYVTF